MKKVQVSEEFYSRAMMLAVSLKSNKYYEQLHEHEKKCINALLAEINQKEAAKEKRMAYNEYRAAKGTPKAKELLERYLSL